MAWFSIAVLGLVPRLLAGGAPAAAPIATVEISFVTRAGEGSTGHKRFHRDGCYQIESEGGTGGGTARDSQAGCHRPADVADAFAALDALSAGAGLVRDAGAGANDEMRVTLIGADGGRWRAAGPEAARTIAAAVDNLPSENQWYAPPPDKPLGKGPQLLVLSASGGQQGRLEASLVADGRWWCYRSAGSRGGAVALPAAKVRPLRGAEAAARLGRILPTGAAHPAGASPAATGGRELSVEVIWPGRDRAPLQPKPLAAAAAARFADEMRGQAAACALP